MRQTVTEIYGAATALTSPRPNCRYSKDPKRAYAHLYQRTRVHINVCYRNLQLSAHSMAVTMRIPLACMPVLGLCMRPSSTYGANFVTQPLVQIGEVLMG